MWATRFWWMLKSLGFKRASVLDGGFEKFLLKVRPIERGSRRGYPRWTFTATPRPGFFVDKHTVLAARNDPRVVVINALGTNSIRVLNRAATAGQVASREASMFLRRHCTTPQPRHSQIRTMQNVSSQHKA